MRKKQFNIFLITALIIISSCDSPREYDYKYNKTKNQYGVEFYYFEGKNPPPLEIEVFEENTKNIVYLNKALEAIGQPPVDINFYSSYRKITLKSFVWDDYNGNQLEVSVIKNNYNDRKNQNYTCIKRIQISPDGRQKLINQAKNSITKEHITKNDYGTDWPFTVDEGILECRGLSKVVFTTFDRKTYAVNGLAMSGNDYLDIHEIWKKDYDSDSGRYFLKIGRADLVSYVSIGSIINRGLSLCE